jgi:hypothetical protein
MEPEWSFPCSQELSTGSYPKPEISTQNYWNSELFPSSGILENTTFRKLDLFPSSGEGGGEGTYSIGPLRKS